MLPAALPYHLKVRDHLKGHTPVWEFFSAAPTREEQGNEDEQNGELEIAGRIVAAIADRADSDPGYLEIARLFQFYTRVYGDRCAGVVTGDPADTEYPLRVRALQLWQEQGEAAGPVITRMVEGPRELGRLDIFSQATIRALTRDLILEYLRPGWMRTPLVTALVHRYFADLRWEEGGDEQFSAGVLERLADGLAGAHGSIRDYFAFVMLDLVLADASLEERSADRARAFAAELRLADSFEHLYHRKSN
jgi:hypothetical protein